MSASSLTATIAIITIEGAVSAQDGAHGGAGKGKGAAKAAAAKGGRGGGGGGRGRGGQVRSFA